jgi:hypothetical protein
VAGVFAASAVSATSAQVVVQIDHHSGAVSIVDDAHIAELVDNKTLRFRRPTTVQLEVINGNTALYDYSISTQPDASSQTNTLQPAGMFLSAVKAYLPELNVLVRRGSRGASAASSDLPSIPSSLTRPAADAAGVALQNGRAVDADLRDLTRLVRGPMDRTLHLTIRALDRMHRGEVEPAAKELADSLQLSAPNCTSSNNPPHARESRASSLGLSTRVIAKVDSFKADNELLATSLANDALLSDSAAHDFVTQLAALHAKADTVLNNYDTTVQSAYRVETMAAAVASGCSRWTATQPLRVAPGANQVVTVRVQPRSEPEVQRVATDVPGPISVTLIPPPNHLSLKLGATALYAPHAQFPTYGVRSAGGTGAQALIYQDKPLDDRFSYGLTLGATYSPWLEHGDFSLWLPEITIADPGGSSGKAAAIGSAISFKSVKLGVGAFWAKHSVLDTLGVGKPLANAQFLKQHDSYGKPVAYFSVSIFNLGDLLGLNGQSGGGSPAPAGGTESATPKAGQGRPSK